MLELLETVAGAITLAFYLAVAVVLPSGAIFLFVGLASTLIRIVLDPLVDGMPATIRAGPLGAAARSVGGVALRVSGVALFLALVGVITDGPSTSVLVVGFERTLVTFAAIGDLVATWMTGRVLNDFLVQIQPAAGEPASASLRQLQVLVARHVHASFRPGVTELAFRWTVAAFETGVVSFWLVFEPLRALRQRVSLMIAPGARETAVSEVALERQAELIAQVLARAAPVPAAIPAPSPPRQQWGRPGTPARGPATVPPSTAEIPSQRVAIVSWDGELAAEMERQLDATGFAPLVFRSVAEAFASRVWPRIVFLDARHLRWLAPDRLPLLVRARLIAVTRHDVRVPPGWQLDAHALESGSDALLDLLRRRDARRKTPGGPA